MSEAFSMAAGAVAAAAPVQLDGADAAAQLAPLAPVEAPQGAADSFGQLVAQGIEGVNGDLLAAQTSLQQLALGDGQDLHRIMMQLEESRLSFGLFMQVRNRLLEAYQDVMRMQV